MKKAMVIAGLGLLLMLVIASVVSAGGPKVERGGNEVGAQRGAGPLQAGAVVV